LPEPSAAPSAPRPAPAPAKILIAEDNFVNRTYVERLLARFGHEVTSAVDGRHALEAHGARKFDLILMDCQMPELDGYETTREIRRREAGPGRMRTPIVAMTASASEEIRRRCLEAGMDDLPGPGPAIPVEALDPGRLSQLRDLFPGEEMAGVLVQLTNEVGAEIARLDAAHAEHDSAGIGAAAHGIRGSAQMIGAVRLADLAGEVEEASKETHIGDHALVRNIAALHEAWAQTRGGIETQVEDDRRSYHQPSGD
jgi:CheY-like chemotaxis protein